MLLTIAGIVGILALVFAYVLAMQVMKQSQGTEKMKEISNAIKQGSKAYLSRQYKTLFPIVVVLAIILTFAINWHTAVAFIVGAMLSALSGFIGMNVSVRSNVRVAQMANRSLEKTLNLAFKGGSIAGLTVVGLGLLGVVVLYGLFKDVSLIIGLGFGASLISLFMRVGGGIYTKAADVGTDLVGKIEKNIPEDDPRNPGVIADQVGDNVGDCAGMGADLFESYVVTLIAAMLLGTGLMSSTGINGILFPVVIGAAAIVASIIGGFFVRLDKDRNIWKALNKGLLATVLISALFFLIISLLMFHQMKYFYASLAGLFVTVFISMITEYYTSRDRKPVQEIAQAATTGAGTNIISGLALGFKSTFLPVIIICIAIFGAYYAGGADGIAIAALAMLSLTGMVVSLDTYGPITDNAGGIAEMSGLSKKARRVTDALDAVGNTTKAVTKGFAIGSAALAALSLFVAYAESTNLLSINILSSNVVIGLFVGAALPFLFSSFCMKAVGKAAFQVVEEVRRQFKSLPIMQGRAKPDYHKCVDITTRAALRGLIAPGLLSVIAPLVVGFLLGPEALGGLLAGVIVTGLLLALTLANAGAAWDNAKKYIEDGYLGGKGSDAHKAAVVGDTVGDPAKDTAGPALNPLIKVINMIALLFAGLIVVYAVI
ncbi:MAG: sodium-translocating pyrophosphatase [Candidatus Aenigmatarchaeota archaeon]